MELHPDDPDDPLVFRFDLSGVGLGTSRIAFRDDAGTGAMALDLEVMPLTAYRRHLEPVARVRRTAGTAHPRS